MIARTLPLVLHALLLAALPAAAADRPVNILICVADDASWAHFSAYGSTWVQTPAFDRLAREGVLFTRAYTPNAKCAPSRASLLTGRNSWQLEAAANHAAYYPAGYRTLMEALGAQGYAIGFTGKGWAPGNPGQLDGRPRELTGPAWNKITQAKPTSGISDIDYAANFSAFLQARRTGQPFCFWFGALEPHRPYEEGSGVRLGGKDPAAIDRVPAYWPDDAVVRSDMLDYALELEYFDRQLGRFIELLQRAGELENTIIVVTSDNGMPFPRIKGASYEASHHMPLVIRWGGISAPGRRADDYVSLIDVAPTLLEATGLARETAGMEPFAGRSLIDLLRGGAAAPARDQVLLGQERHDVGRPGDVGYPVRGIIRDGYLYFRNFEPGRWPMCDPITGYLNTDGGPTKSLILSQNRQGVNHRVWQLNFGRRPAEELYDLQTDPDCTVNLALEPAQAERRAGLEARLLAALRQQGDPRLAGQGAVFDGYPHANNPGFYERFIRGETVRAFWVNPTDFEQAGFDPEHPLTRPEATKQP